MTPTNDPTPQTPPAEPAAPDDVTLLGAAAGEPEPQEPDTILGAAAGEAPKEAPSTAPEEYAEFEVPEGVESLDAALIDQFKPVAKELGLTQEQAQKLVAFQALADKTRAEAANAEHQQTVAAWRKEITELSNFKELQSHAARALKAYGKDPEVNHFFTKTWLGNHPLVLRFLANAGAAVAEDTFAGSTGGNPAKNGDARGLYTSMPNP